MDACLESLLAALGELPTARGIYLLANGCTDRTEAVVTAYAPYQVPGARPPARPRPTRWRNSLA